MEDEKLCRGGSSVSPLRLILLGSLIFGQATVGLTQSTVPSDPPAIEDNSFLIEEAYNQEAGVVQHISTFQRDRNGNFTYSFTQEWPVTGRKHQFSYTIALLRLAEGSRGKGFGDVALNYRFQLIDNDRVAVAPRATLLLPTGEARYALGRGSVGFQFNVPVSTKLSRRFVAHTNVGATFVPRARNELRERAATEDYFVGQSIIWLTNPRFNMVVEALHEWRESVRAPRQTIRENSFIVNPGIRWAHNFKSGLQIVPGISIPTRIGPSRGEPGVFFYLSFEHPFRKH